MKRFFVFVVLCVITCMSHAQLLSENNVTGTSDTSMQYFRPENPKYFAGDCMPFYHDGVFHLFWLLDENHHKGLNGLGGHQWEHSSTKDLVHWQHHPMALPITADWEKSMCTGSVFFHDGTYYAFYATRTDRDGDLRKEEHLSVATSKDGIHFIKSDPNPFASPVEGYNLMNYRDPFVFLDKESGVFHMLVTASLQNMPVYRHDGCLAHMTSSDLKKWTLEKPFLFPAEEGIPECSELFYWNGWYYLVYSPDGNARYRMSRDAFGPWKRPKIDIFEGSMARVMKTAEFVDNRRIGAAFLPTRKGNKDNGGGQYAGNVIFREIIQHENGTLGIKFPQEMIPVSGEPRTYSFKTVIGDAKIIDNDIHISSMDGFGCAKMKDVPLDAHITLTVSPEKESASFGLNLRASKDRKSSCLLHFLPFEQKVILGNQFISIVEGLDRSFELEIILKGDIIDVCIDNRRCIINRCPEQNGTNLFLFSKNASVSFESLTIRPLL